MWAIPINACQSTVQLFTSPLSDNNTLGDIVRLVWVKPEEDPRLYDELNQVLEKHHKGNLEELRKNMEQRKSPQKPVHGAEASTS